MIFFFIFFLLFILFQLSTLFSPFLTSSPQAITTPLAMSMGHSHSHLHSITPSPYLPLVHVKKLNSTWPFIGDLCVDYSQNWHEKKLFGGTGGWVLSAFTLKENFRLFNCSWDTTSLRTGTYPLLLSYLIFEGSLYSLRKHDKWPSHLLDHLFGQASSPQSLPACNWISSLWPPSPWPG